MSRPALAALAEQQQIIEGLRRTVAKQGLVLDYIARMAGLTNEVTAIRRHADIENPAQPVANPASQPATESTEQAVTPETADSPLNPGQTPGSVQHLPAAVTTDPTIPGTTVPTEPFSNLTEVTAPVSGAETQVPLEQTRTEVDVRVGDPMNLERAFPWTISPDAQGGSPESGEFAGGAKAANRMMASLRLARLRIEAGLERGDDLVLAAGIEANASLSDAAIEAEIDTLGRVNKVAARRTASRRPANAVPRPASGVQRTTPSLVGNANPGLTSEASVASGDDAEDIFL